MPAKASGFLDFHHRLIAAGLVALLVYLGLRHHVSMETQIAAVWDGFALTTLVLDWLLIRTGDPYDYKRQARLNDAGRTFLFTVVVAAAASSLFAMTFLLHSAKTLGTAELGARVALSISAIGLSWVLVHTLFAIRYAYHFYDGSDEGSREDVAGGLVFPGNGSPCYTDFAYFSFVIGMTCQVSDVQISSPRLRRLALIHGLISFVYNTAIIALFVNVIAGLL